jgi:hypothetical protein
MPSRDYSRTCSRLLAFVLLASIALEAKGTTVKLTLTGPGIAVPIEIVAPDVLAGSNVWEGSFLGAALDGVPRVKKPIYTVSFDVQTPEWMRQPVKTMYAVSVARDAATGELVLYLPGRGQPGYSLNVSAMLRDGQDGQWHRPPLTWATAIGKYIP